MKKQSIDHTKLLVLSLLAGEDMYGYQMIVELGRRSNHTFEMKEGTLYPILHALEADRLVTVRERAAESMTRLGKLRYYLQKEKENSQ